MPMTIAGGRGDQPDLAIDELLRLLRYEKGRGDTHKISPIGSMYAIYGNMDPINIPQSC